ncbi:MULTISPECIES: HoxN/HupN/NixA family nickel/cobalt transporter [unclassified Paenibacillus]|uniref:HoxN/HupN/NixA family nickel/cobalt transporter n=1 Tax=unclassified Paenibacillus TaxID=185978 RepID=UPI0024049F35|nr:MULTISPECIES: HoxN/HupN/NixA family nickel/cobalt transporter [unclassified Paenibacillus]MDF9839761.1 high-affinity nickel-transport protein [Paenibacillus sp. PastF-2]MDF9846341.1 high-affinity nickel-transport protein [Paenibacillus sp. PastM-2]MDF9853309.1 high-affinity nickel-transport protein [Paenibacillus sp. PastF-1]MDH6478187.1 high-affinity nickel-transport protein [Paenibacillus sp. PastH-2]MDH6506314.1 high-affinity nickel-transport protein [Paenibacillus sp. PastM-3]
MLEKVWRARRNWAGYFIVIIILHIAGITGLLAGIRADPAFWGLGLLAYTLGLRHAFDLDHIAAIDNTVRKLVQQRRNPLGVGFYFALGHSSVVFLLVLAVIFSFQWVQEEMPQLQRISGVVGSAVLSAFLILIGIVNLLILLHMVRVYRKARKGCYQAGQLDELSHSHGMITRFIKPLFRFINHSWQVYPIGFLFGLGFDTATEIGLLAISAGAVHNEIPLWGILSLPFLFAAGMSLMDTADGMFMTTAYRWAFSDPIRKLYYNMTVTAISVMAALSVGLVELVKIVSKPLPLQSPVSQWIQNIDFGNSGYVLVALFIGAWIISLSAWKAMKSKKRAEA